MTDYTDAARNKDHVRLTDCSELNIYYIPAGVDGWNIPVICAYDHHDDCLFWDMNGIALGHDANIIEIVTND